MLWTGPSHFFWWHWIFDMDWTAKWISHVFLYFLVEKDFGHDHLRIPETTQFLHVCAYGFQIHLVKVFVAAIPDNLYIPRRWEHKQIKEKTE